MAKKKPITEKQSLDETSENIRINLHNGVSQQ